MSFSTWTSAIRAFIDAQWALAQPMGGKTIPLVHENTNYTPVGGEEFVRLSFLEADTLQADLSSSPFYRTTGFIVMQGFFTKGDGSGLGYTVADSVVGFLRNAVLDSGAIRVRVPSIDVVGDVGNWWQLNILTPFWADYT